MSCARKAVLSNFPRFVLALLTWASWTGSALAHDVRPALLQITERNDGRYDFTLKLPRMGDSVVHLVPHVTGDLLENPPIAIESSPEFLTLCWCDIDAGPMGLRGRRLQIDGIEQTITDVMVRMERADGAANQHLLSSRNPSLPLDASKSGIDVSAYLQLGIEHILEGPDHLLFVLGLILLVRSRGTLIKTVTAFTVAHSITLIATALNVIAIPPAIAETLVALSVAFVAIEVMKVYRERPSLAARYPWLVAFAFGLLHGCAFAGALGETGLPRENVLAALLLFNVGVEVGQLLFVLVVLTARALLARISTTPSWIRWIPPYAIGSLAAFWFFDRLSAAMSSGISTL